MLGLHSLSAALLTGIANLKIKPVAWLYKLVIFRHLEGVVSSALSLAIKLVFELDEPYKN